MHTFQHPAPLAPDDITPLLSERTPGILCWTGFIFLIISIMSIGIASQCFAVGLNSDQNKEMIDIKSCLGMKMEFDSAADTRQTVSFTSLLTNQCHENIQIHVGPEPLDLTLTNVSTGRYWVWSQYRDIINDDKYLSATLPTLDIVDLAPGMSKQFSVNWDFSRISTEKTPPGNYIVQGRLKLIDVLMGGKSYGQQSIVNQTADFKVPWK